MDLGLKALVTTSDGEKVEPPKFLRRAEKRLKRLQRNLSAKKKGSKSRRRARHLLAVQHSKVRNRRTDFNHKLASRLVMEHGLVVFEDLQVRNMVRNRALAKSIHDAGWRQLVMFAEHKAARNGRTFVTTVPAPFTTQECGFCGALNEATLDVREFECSSCHRILDRDVNAARVVLKRGIAQVGLDRPELTPAETAPPPRQTTGGASMVAEAGTTHSANGTAGSPRPSVVGGCHSASFRKTSFTPRSPRSFSAFRKSPSDVIRVSMACPRPFRERRCATWRRSRLRSRSAAASSREEPASSPTLPSGVKTRPPEESRSFRPYFDIR